MGKPFVKILATVAFTPWIIADLSASDSYVDLGGPATGYIAMANVKNSTSQDGIENKGVDVNGQPNVNGLPDYPNYEIPAGATNSGIWTAIMAGPQSTAADYATDFSNAFYGGASITVNNQNITQADYSTMSAGRIHFMDSLISGNGTETIGVNDLIFDFNTYEWDGTTASGFDATSFNPFTFISPFSPVYTEYNAGGGAGNAQFYYRISVENPTGTGLTFEDGALASMDITGDLVVNTYGITTTSLFAEFNGTFTASGLAYSFDLADRDSVAVFSDILMIMNREGTATFVPEPGSFALLLALASFSGLLIRRRR